MIQLRRSEVIFNLEDIDRLRVEFRRRRCALLPGILEPALLDFLLCRLEGEKWRQTTHGDIRVEIISTDQLVLEVLHFLINGTTFLDVIKEISESDAITWFGGRVYRMMSNSNHYDSWHDDDAQNRLVGMSINLSSQVYTGGIFQMREQNSGRLLSEIANTGLGDATIFRISGDLEHRVTDVTGNHPKTAFAGWFLSGAPDLAARLKGVEPRIGQKVLSREPPT